jgi:hypothetical protein
MAYSGLYTILNPQKYIGDTDKNRIKYLSLWERNCMKFFDSSPSIIKWTAPTGNKSLKIPYISPIDNKQHNYIPDFFVKVKTREGIEKKYLLEIKPSKQCEMPNLPKSGRKTRAYNERVKTYVINKAKWYFAEQWCQKFGYEFKILTEATIT